VKKVRELYDGHNDDIYKCKQPKHTQSKTYISFEAKVEPANYIQNCCYRPPNVTTKRANKNWDNNFDHINDNSKSHPTKPESLLPRFLSELRL